MITFDKPLKYGLIGGLALVTYAVLMYAMDVSVLNPIFAFTNVIITFGVTITLAVMAINKMRVNDFGGTITYLQALIAGFVVILVAFYVYNIFDYLLNGLIDPENLPRKVDDFLLTMEGKVPEETFDELVNTLSKNIDPMKNFVKSLWVNPLMAIGISAIVSIFVRKKPVDKLV